MRLFGVALLALLASLLPLAAPAAAAPCPGAATCPYTPPAASLGLMGEGVLRDATAVAVTPSGGVVIADGMIDRVVAFTADGGSPDELSGRMEGAGAFRGPTGVAVDGAGNLYVADTHNARVQKLSPQGTHLASLGEDLLQLQGDVAIAPNGHVFVFEGQFVAELNTAGAVVRRFGADGDTTTGFNGGEGIAVDGNGRVFVAERWANRVRVFDVSGSSVAHVTDIAAVGLQAPTGVAIDGAGDVFVVGDDTVREFSVSGATVTPGASATLDLADPTGIAVNALGTTVYVTEAATARKLTVSAGTLTEDTRWGFPPHGHLYFPEASAFSNDGSKLYVADTKANRIQVFNFDGGTLHDVFGAGDGDGTEGSAPGEFRHPGDVAVAPDGRVVVADFGNRRVQVLGTDGVQQAQITAGDDEGTLSPSAVAVDSAGHIFVGDAFAGRVYEYTLSGTTATRVRTYGADSGSASMASVTAVTAGPDHESAKTILVADGHGHRIVQFNAETGAFVKSFGASGGGGNGTMQIPNGVDWDPAVGIVVSDVTQNVQIFDAAGAFVRGWGGAGTADGQHLYTQDADIRPGSPTVAVTDSFGQLVKRYDLTAASGGGGGTAGELDTAWSDDGIVDTNFNNNALGRTVERVPGSDKVYVAGQESGFGIALVRYDADGTPDPTFDGDGIATNNLPDVVDEVIVDVVVDRASGKVTGVGRALGGSPTQARTIVVRWLPTGALDTSFSGDGWMIVPDANGTPLAMEGTGIAKSGSGVVIVAHQTTGSRMRVVRLQSDGDVDDDFGTNGTDVDFGGGNAKSGRLIVQDGKPVLVASVADDGVSPQGPKLMGVARLTSDGALDTSFDGDGKKTIDPPDGPLGKAHGIAAHGANVFVAGGDGAHAVVARLGATGGLVSSFGTNGFATIGPEDGATELQTRDIVVDADGRVALAGTAFGSIGSQAFVAQFDEDGMPHAGFGTDGDGITTLDGDQSFGGGLAQAYDGDLLVGGYIARPGVFPAPTDFRFLLAKFNGLDDDATAPSPAFTEPAALNDGDPLTPVFAKATTKRFRGTAGTLATDAGHVTLKRWKWDGVEWDALTDATATVTDAGTWEYAGWSLEDGTYDIEAVQADGAGNEGASGRTRFRVDQTAPAGLSIHSSNGARYADSTPTIQGFAGSGQDDLQQVKVLVYREDGDVLVDEQTVNVNALVWEATLGPLDPDDYFVKVEQADEWGNTATYPASGKHTLSVEVERPRMTYPRPNLVYGPSRDFEFEGEVARPPAAAGEATFRVYQWDGSKWNQFREYTVATDGRGARLRNFTLPGGTYEVQLRQRGYHGDGPTADRGSDTVRFRVDYDGPGGLSLDEPSSGAVLKTPQVTFRGRASTHEEDRDSLAVFVYKRGGYGRNASGDLVDSATAGIGRDGRWSASSGFKLPNGQYEAVVQHFDDYDNKRIAGPVPFTVAEPPDADPTVIIARPTNGATYREGDRIQVLYECRDERVVTECRGDHPSGTTIDAGPPGQKEFRVTARDNGGHTKVEVARYTVLPPAASSGVQVQGVELIQAVQREGVSEPFGSTIYRPGLPMGAPTGKYDGVRLVQGKSSLARAFVYATRPIKVYLYGFHPASGGKWRAAGDPLSPVFNDKVDVSTAPPDTKQRNANGGYLFQVPASWMKSSLELVAVAIPTTTPSVDTCDECTSTNAAALTDINPIKSKGFVLGMIEFGDRKKDMAKIEEHLERTAEILPIADGALKFTTNFLTRLTWPATEVPRPQQQGVALDRAVKWTEEQKDNYRADFTFAIAAKSTDAGIQVDGPIFTPKECGGFLNLSCTWNRPVMLTVADERPLTGTGHEIGHGLGREHASSCTSGQDVGGFEDWPRDQKGWIQGVAFDPWKLNGGEYSMWDGIKADSAWDHMSYCSPNGGGDPSAWISPRGWNKVLDRLRNNSSQIKARAASASASGGPRARAAQSNDTITVRGLSMGGAVTITSVGGGGTSAPGPAGSPYQASTLDAGGKPVQTVPLASSVTHENRGAHGAIVSATLPRRGAEAIALTGPGGAVLATVKRSPNAPAVKLLSPKAKARIGTSPSVRVAWRATDADGDKTTAKVEFSDDGGRRWSTVAADVAGSSVDIPRDRLAASKNARIRVVVNDGFNDGAATSGRLVSEGAPPTVRILSPQAGTRRSSDAQLPVSGAATDDRGRSLGDGALRWYIGKRLVGRGSADTIEGLPPGRPVLRLEARDRLGRVASDTVRLRVSAAQPQLMTLRAPKKLGRRARSVVLRLKANVPATLRVGTKRYRVDRTLRRVRVPVKAGSGPLKLKLALSSGGKRSASTLTIAR